MHVIFRLCLGVLRTFMVRRPMHVSIIASGRVYQEAAAWAAATYVKHLQTLGSVSVYVPSGETCAHLLASHSREFGFAIKSFPFEPTKAQNLNSELQCKGFWHAVSDVGPEELLFIVDADTFCAKPLVVSEEISDAIAGGKIGFVKDICNRHSRKKEDPWFLSYDERRPYVNAGVVLASANSLVAFSMFLELSKQSQFLHATFYGQSIINYALGKYFKDRLLILDRQYNSMGYFDSSTIIGHFAGGMGGLGDQRKAQHLQKCAEIINSSKYKGQSE